MLFEEVTLSLNEPPIKGNSVTIVAFVSCISKTVFSVKPHFTAFDHF